MSKNFFRFILIFLGIWIVLLTFYSFTQIDLNLTLFSNHPYQLFQNQLIQIGYYQRGLSLLLFSILLISITLIYLILLYKLQLEKLPANWWKLIIALLVILVIAYPAFSYDIFNYIFDARIVTKYHLSPYFFNALDFPSDPWIRFMHWTHRYFPYGPIWLLICLIPSVLGWGKFILTLGLFKLMFFGFYLINLWLISKILLLINSKNPHYALVYFALNPLIIIESIVSPHNEVMLLTGVLLSIYLILINKKLPALLGFLFGVGVKFINIIMLPLCFIFPKKFQRFIHFSIYLWLLALIPLVAVREIYAWYLIPLLGLAAINTNKYTQGLIFGLSIGALVRYWPFIYFGEYTGTTMYLQNISFVITAFLGLIIFLLCQRKTA